MTDSPSPAIQEEERAYHEVCAYTLSHGDSAFIHQHVVDAYTAQHADQNTKAIAITFALIGLYLHVEKSYTGREVRACTCVWRSSADHGLPSRLHQRLHQ